MVQHTTLRIMIGASCLALMAGCITNTATKSSETDVANIIVSPEINRVIEGVSELDRKIYFNISDAGTDFRQRCKSDERYEYLRDMQINFGRQLGPVEAAVKWRNAVREDSDRPGYVDLKYLKEQLQKSTGKPDPKMMKDFVKLDVAAHGNHNAFPDFIEMHTTEEAQKDHYKDKIPANADAAAELAAYVMAHGYSDLDRPAYYEPLNEPHWSLFDEKELHSWHIKTMEKVHELAPGVKVGGPCQSVSYMYVHDYGTFRGWCNFLKGTEGKMDFYSFHCYDYFGEKDGDFGGRITSGLPLEGVLDMIPNYTLNTFNKTYDIIISEHGGYELGGGVFTEKLAKQHIPGEGFEWEMKKRSIADYNALTTFFANIFCFMNHPHTVKKAVPFILLESMDWDPKYYSTLYTANNYTDKDDWVLGGRIKFYEFFKDVQGRYVKILNNDPDIQSVALVDENKLFVLLNNISEQPIPVNLNVKKGKRMSIRLYGRNSDFTPYYTDKPLKSLKALTLGKRESAVLIVEYKKPVKSKATIDEMVFYSDKVAVPVPAEGQNFTINVPQGVLIDYASLRIGFVRPFDLPKEAVVLLNGEKLSVPMEDSADRFSEKDKEFATTRFIPVDPAKLFTNNTVKVIFPDGGKASVGSVVIRAGLK